MSDPSLAASSMFSNRKSFTCSIRARLSRSSSETFDAPPTPPLPRSSSSHTLASSDEVKRAWMTVAPPPFPPSARYTACYCEENVYHLASHLSAQLAEVNRAALGIARQRRDGKVKGMFVPVWDLHVVFISNEAKTVLLYQQAASKLVSAGWPVVWDYHVVAVATCCLVPLSELATVDGEAITFPGGSKEARSWVYDFDSVLSKGQKVVGWDEYMRDTFRETAPCHLQPMFRCVAANDYLGHFASDRSHMRMSEGWCAPPPTWQPIQGTEAIRTGCSNNLMSHYVDVTFDAKRYGKVWQGADWTALSSVPSDEKLGASLIGIDELGRQNRTAVVESSAQRETAMSKQPKDRNGGAKGGRIASPLFPAYLHASQQNRVKPSPPPTPLSSVSTMM